MSILDKFRDMENPKKICHNCGRPVYAERGCPYCEDLMIYKSQPDIKYKKGV